MAKKTRNDKGYPWQDQPDPALAPITQPPAPEPQPTEEQEFNALVHRCMRGGYTTGEAIRYASLTVYGIPPVDRPQPPPMPMPPVPAPKPTPPWIVAVSVAGVSALFLFAIVFSVAVAGATDTPTTATSPTGYVSQADPSTPTYPDDEKVYQNNPNKLKDQVNPEVRLAEGAYLTTVRANITALQGESDTHVLAVGYRVCKLIDQDNDPVAETIRKYDLPTTDASFIVGAAKASLCEAIK